jgi:hypothetical protein
MSKLIKKPSKITIVNAFKYTQFDYCFNTIVIDSVVNLKKGAKMKALQGLSGTIASLTNIVISLLGLAIVVSLLGGNVPFVGGVADNIVGLVQGLGDAGIVGLIAAIVILNLYK